MAAISGHIPSLRRQIKNVACNYSDAQVKVREATSNDPWGASSSLMSEIADLTYNAMAFTEIMQIIWKRLNDSGKNWRHVYKSLVLLDYLIKVGSEKVAHQCRENIFAIQTLKDFQHIEDNKDQGMNVREKAKQLVAILKDDERLKNERTKALMARKRFVQNGFGGSTEIVEHRRIETCHSASELEECRPTSAGEEEMQLQIALALSQEEAEKEQEVRRSDEVRLQLAIQESETDPKRLLYRHETTPLGQSTSTSAAKNSSALDDLMTLQYGAATTTSSTTDPWAVGQPSSAMNGFFGSDIGSSITAPSDIDPWASAAVGDEKRVATSESDFFATAATKQQGVDAASVDPWTSSTTGNVFPTTTSSVEQVGDPWGADILAPSVVDATAANNNLATATTGNGSESTTKSRQLRTPESFLGENSNLVNLDNLMAGSTKSAFPGIPPRAASSAANPFAASVPAATATTNPFAVQQKRATPTLNEMRGDGATGNGGSWATASNPSAAANNKTNPFL